MINFFSPYKLLTHLSDSSHFHWHWPEKKLAAIKKTWTKTPVDLLRQKCNWPGFILKNDDSTDKQQYIVYHRLREEKSNQRTRADISFLSILFYKIWQWLNGNFVPMSWFSQISYNCRVITRQTGPGPVQLAVTPSADNRMIHDSRLFHWHCDLDKKTSMRDDCRLI